jgi:hypothetical protein
MKPNPRENDDPFGGSQAPFPNLFSKLDDPGRTAVRTGPVLLSRRGDGEQ